MRPRTLPSLTTFSLKPHGTRTRYMSGCRCMQCRSAESQYRCERRNARKSGDWNGIISAEKARKHLLDLKRAGVGYPLVSDASGISRRNISDIRSGKSQRIRARTERAILLVDRHARTGGTLVSAKPTWKRIQELLDEGFTEGELCRRLGYACKKLQFNGEMVTAKTEQKVAKLYREVMEVE